ncbi:PREDICTED: uncharacterized protein LOC104988964 [Bison bison bison]|uniref:Uncharacterized protein LOC104988964 n=1 Tax=Bison bison bison TaxID=43346 RepID=A0A6P3H9I0_BISBB|nr:PREDICTED: uncharacterized protein LOC104988964 [Bison bison bison]
MAGGGPYRACGVLLSCPAGDELGPVGYGMTDSKDPRIGGSQWCSRLPGFEPRWMVYLDWDKEAVPEHCCWVVVVVAVPLRLRPDSHSGGDCSPGDPTVIEHLRLNGALKEAAGAGDHHRDPGYASGDVCRGFGRLTLVLIESTPAPAWKTDKEGSLGARGGSPGGWREPRLQQLPLAPGCPLLAAGLNVSQGPRAGRPLRPDGRLVAQDEGHRPGTGQGRSRALHWSVLWRRNSSQRTCEDPAWLSWDTGWQLTFPPTPTLGTASWSPSQTDLPSELTPWQSAERRKPPNWQL